MPINAEEVYLASRVARATVEVAESLAREVFSHPSGLLNSAGTSGTTKALIAVADGTVQAPAIVGERMGTMLTPTRLQEFAEDLFTRAYTKWKRDYEFEDKVHESGWDFSRVRSETSRALEQAGIFADLNKPGAAAEITEQLAGKPEAVSAYESLLALQRAEAPNAMRVSALSRMESRFIYSDDIKGILSELAHPNTGLALNEQLFGSARAAEQFGKYSINFGNAISNFDQLPESVQAEYRNDLYGDLRTAIKEMHKITEPFHTAYRASAHETEAFNNADYADSFTAAVNARVRGY